MTACSVLLHPVEPIVPGAIAIFDSGVGGLSVLRHMVVAMPDAPIVYVADNQFAPYGDRAVSEIEERCKSIVHVFNQANVRAVVVACNTATVWAISRLRQWYSMPIFGVEPAVKPALLSPGSRVVGVVATTRTLESDSFHQLCERYKRADATILPMACPKWVELVESNKMGTAESFDAVRQSLQPLIAAGMDTLVLGCTHFPMLIPEIRLSVGPAITILEPGAAVVRHLVNTLKSSMLHSDNSLSVGAVDFRLTKHDDRYLNKLLQIWHRFYSSAPFRGD